MGNIFHKWDWCVAKIKLVQLQGGNSGFMMQEDKNWKSILCVTSKASLGIVFHSKSPVVALLE